jgi:HAD superfamily hydrolase (TIGR01490 family)
VAERVAIFDLDGTLYRGRVWEAVVRHFFSARVHRGAALLYLIRNFGRYGLYRAGVVPRDLVWERFARDLPGLFRGMSEARAREVVEAIYRERIEPDLDPALLARWQSYGEQGARRFIVSGAPAPVVEFVGERLGATAALGTIAEKRDGRFTGKVSGEVCQDAAKATRMRAFIAQTGWEVDWTASHAYADSHSDLPILELVGHPVAVRPDPGLLAHATARGWPVIGEPVAR